MVVAMLQYGGDTLVTFIAEIFNDVFWGGYDPECWKETKLKVLYKKGDPQVLDNYRPIVIPAVLYEQFSRVLQERVKTTLDRSSQWTRPLSGRALAATTSCL